jgi:hypothetical protein
LIGFPFVIDELGSKVDRWVTWYVGSLSLERRADMMDKPDSLPTGSTATRRYDK